MEENGKQASKAISKPSADNSPRQLNAETPEARESQRRTAVEFMGQQGIRTDAWGMEVLKSLLIISVGTLAGAAALLVNKDKLSGASSALTYLGIAIGLAFSAFVTGWLVHRTQLAQMYKNHAEFVAGATADIYRRVSGWTFPFFWATVILALVSFLFLTLGAIAVLSLLQT